MEWVHGRCIIFICYLLFFSLSPTLCLHLRRAIQPFPCFFFFFLYLSSWTLFWVWPFLLLQISTLHSFEDPQLGGIRHTYFFPSVIIPSDCLGFVKRKRYPFTSYDLIEYFNAQAGVFFFSFSFFFIGGRIVDGFAFSWLGRKEGKGGWMDTISEVLLLD